MQEYVLGFLFNKSKTKVALIKKTKPVEQNGKHNGIGGKLEKGETIHEAMRREFNEEAGVWIESWKQFGTLFDIYGKVYIFKAFVDDYIIDQCRTVEDKGEIVRVYDYTELPHIETLANTRWLLDIAVDPNDVFIRIEYPLAFGKKK